MEKVTFKLEAVTPLFMSGAIEDQCEFRASSIKGLLRFWFRALHPEPTSPKFFDQEQHLFGSQSGRAPFRLRVETLKEVPGKKGDSRWAKDIGVAYLGYGPITKGSTRGEFFDSGSQFQIEFLFDGFISEEELSRIMDSFGALCLIGGVGSRSRRGFGSIKVIECSGLPPDQAGTFHFKNQAAYAESLNSLLGHLDLPSDAELPDHTAFSSHTQVLVMPKQFKAGTEALRHIGSLLHRFRSFKADKRFKEDHDLMVRFLNGEETRVAPLRSAFGLPHNYFFSHDHRKGAVDYVDSENSKGRRASPLFIHIQGFENGSACAVVAFVPAKFLPKGAKIQLEGERRRAVVDFPGYGAVKRFMDYLKEEGSK